MKIAVVIPHGHDFGEQGATSIDLCAVEFASYSKYIDTTTFFVNQVANPLSHNCKFFEKRNLTDLCFKLRDHQPDLIVVHQNLKYAYFLSKNTNAKVLLHRHNYYERKGPLSVWNKSRQFNRLAGLIVVSHSVAEGLRRDFPRVKTSISTTYNGINVSDWAPSSKRRKVIVFAGRAHPTKGATQLLEALTSTLPEFPDWSAELYVSRGHSSPIAMGQILSLARALPDRITVIPDAPFSQVKSALQTAEISVMPTQDPEPFGRSAIEAMAGGAALIASKLGGLSEVLAKDVALPLEDLSASGIAAAIGMLIKDNGLRSSLALAGRRHVIANFSLERTSSELDRLYQYVVSTSA